MSEYKKDRIFHTLEEEILSGSYPVGSKLPTEAELCRKFEVARITVRAALAQLEDCKLIRRSRPEGSFVLSPEQHRKRVLLVLPSPEQMTEATDYHFVLAGGIAARLAELSIECEQIQASFVPDHLDDARNFCGIILTACHFTGNEILLKRLKNLNLPMVLAHGFARDTGRTGIASIITDTKRAWSDGLRALADRGHRSIILLMRNWSSGRERLNFGPEELPELFRSAGLEPEKQTIVFVNQKDNVEKPLRQALKQAPEATALFCYSDYYALRSYPILQAAGIRIPEQLAVLGFSAQKGSERMTPPLSTVDFNYRFSGKLAVDLLLKIRKGELAEDTVIQAPYEMVFRKSTDFYIFPKK